MQATEILVEEHEVILQVLKAMETVIHKAENNQWDDASFFVEAAEFIKGFADGCHHKKEEDVLFIALQEHGMPLQDSPIQVMMTEHKQGRAFTRQMRQAALHWQSGDPSASKETLYYAKQYLALLYQHIDKENNILFPMAAQLIPPEACAKLIQDYEHIEHEETGEGIHEKYLSLAQSLTHRAASG